MKNRPAKESYIAAKQPFCITRVIAKESSLPHSMVKGQVEQVTAGLCIWAFFAVTWNEGLTMWFVHSSFI